VHRCIRICLFVAVAALYGCAPGARGLLYIDPYEFEVLKAEGIDRRALKQTVADELKIRIDVPPQMAKADQALQLFSAVVARRRPAWVYLSAAHPFDQAEAARRFPAIRFFTDVTASPGTDNRISLIYDRERANYEAGRAIAALLEDRRFLEEIDSAVGNVGILTAVRNERVSREVSAFTDGFSSFSSTDRIVAKEIGNITDRVKARRLLDDMKARSVVIVVLKTYVLSGFCLEYLAKEGGLAVVDEATAQQAYGDTVLLMLVEDFPAALARISEYLMQENPNGQVTAPVQLRWNPDYESVVTEILAEVEQQ
jgi:hypothetical protein